MTRTDNRLILSTYTNNVLPVREKYYNTFLSPRFWTNTQFNKDVRKKLLKIAKDFYKKTNITVPIIDIQLTGSLANYNYTKYSDLDVHLILNFIDINENVALVKQALDGVRYIWNKSHDIIIRGHDVELYFQDVNEQHTASGLFSLLKNKWVKQPVYDPPEIDERDVNLKFQSYVAEIHELEQQLKTDLDITELLNINNRARKLKEKIQRDRKECLLTEDEFCVENLVFKQLRNTGQLEQLISIANTAYDRIYSEK